MRGDDPGGAKAHVHDVLAREYWHCVGLAENARSEQVTYRETLALFEAEQEKWNARAAALLEQLGGKVPDNPVHADRAEALADAPSA